MVGAIDRKRSDRQKPGGENAVQGRSAKRLIPPLETIEGIDRKPFDCRKRIPEEEREALDSSSGRWLKRLTSNASTVGGRKLGGRPESFYRAPLRLESLWPSVPRRVGSRTLAVSGSGRDSGDGGGSGRSIARTRLMCV
jgi:hypothetical protein